MSLMLWFCFCIITMSKSRTSLLIRNDFWIFNDFLMLYCSIHKRDCFIIKLFMTVFSSSFFFFIKCMQSMTMTLSRRCIYAKLHVIWSKSLLYIFSLINHIDSLHIQALFLNSRHRTLIFLCFFALFAFYSFVSNRHFLVAIQVFFKYFSVVILSILMMNSVNIVSVFLSWAFFLSFICSAL